MFERLIHKINRIIKEMQNQTIVCLRTTTTRDSGIYAPCIALIPAINRLVLKKGYDYEERM